MLYKLFESDKWPFPFNNIDYFVSWFLFRFFSSESVNQTNRNEATKIEDEPEDEKNIRLGNLTAFGSILKSELKKDNFKNYLKQLQAEQQGEGDESRKRKQKIRSDLIKKLFKFVVLVFTLFVIVSQS